MRKRLLKGLPVGIYRIYWREGGSSVASVGYDEGGNGYWFAATDWTGVSYNWDLVENLVLITVQNLEHLDFHRNQARKVARRIARAAHKPNQGEAE